MLIEFKVKNFRSFQNEVVFSMVASADKTLYENTHLVPEFGNRNLLKSTVIYGANAAGKSNLIAAIGFLDQFVNTSMDRKLDKPIEASPFLLSSETTQTPSEFEITFLDQQGVRYQYGFHVTTERVVREWLLAYPKGLPQTWFERKDCGNFDTGPEWSFGRNLKGRNAQVAELTRQDVLFLSNAAKLNHHQLKQVFSWFKKSLRVINAEETDKGLFLYSAVKAKNDNNTFHGIQSLLKIADLGISGFNIEERIYTEKDFPDEIPAEIRSQFINQKTLDIYMRHPAPSTIENEILLPIEEESSGTQRYFALSGPLYDVLENGWTLFIDELDSSLHPLLVRHIVSLFHNPQINRKGAQLIFNTHDTTLMDCCLFRRDQIWFVEKDRQGCSHLYPLLDFSPRKNEALEKGYLMGRYGAIPFLGEPKWGEAQHAEA